MRKIKVGAVQPHYIGIPAPYNPDSACYKKDPEAIVREYVARQFDVTAALLNRAGEAGCDAVTTSEGIDGLYSWQLDVTGSNIYAELLELSAPMIEAGLSEIAKKHSMVVVGCYNKRCGGRNYNTAAVFDRKGRVAGEYRKTHLPPDEKWQTAEGDSLDVFELDFGRIGVTICYDVMFPEQMRVLALKGAEVVFHPTLGYGWYEGIGEATIRTRANDNGIYIVAAKNYQFNMPGRSGVVDPWGHILADAGYAENAVVTCDIDLDEGKKQPDWYFPVPTSGIADVAERLRRERRPDLYGTLTEPLKDRFTGLSREEQLVVMDKIKKGECSW